MPILLCFLYILPRSVNLSAKRVYIWKFVSTSSSSSSSLIVYVVIIK